MWAVISIHALLAESDGGGLLSCSAKIIFLSTLSLRRATNTPIKAYNIIKDFYPRSPCGERHHRFRRRPVPRNNFYPRSPCGERRCYSLRHSASCWHFYPRSPCGERRLEPDRAGKQSAQNFYPRSPCGERLIKRIMSHTVAGFLSTLSLRRATNERRYRPQTGRISIHALLAESDCLLHLQMVGRRNFYPRSPCGERLT